MNGGPAFPTTKPLDSWGDPNQGMTLRDYFAAKAMQSYATKSIPLLDNPEEYIARHAYRMADAMIAERERLVTVATEES